MRRSTWLVRLVLSAGLVGAPRVAVSASPDRIYIDDTVSPELDGAVRVRAFIDIAAPPRAVWDAVLDFDARAAENGLIRGVFVYSDQPEALRYERRARWSLSVVGFDVVYHTIYDCDMGEATIEWWLDPHESNDLTIARGRYELVPSPGRPDHTRLRYDFEVASRHEGPVWLRRKLARRSVKKLLEAMRHRAKLGSE